MKDYTIYFATNRNHIGDDRWHPVSYGKDFSSDGRENLRFGKVIVPVDDDRINKYHDKAVEDMGTGDGVELSSYFTDCVENGSIEAFPEKIDDNISDDHQEKTRFGSQRFFDELKDEMMQSSDVLVFIHGFNVTWDSAVGTALSLQSMLNRPGTGDENQKVLVVLFTWPSDGSLFPYRAYKSDRADARDSGYAVGRAFLKLRDFLIKIREEHRFGKTDLCNQDIHLLCHSMGNYVLQNALQRMQEYNLQPVLPRIFKNIFLCSPDVDDTVLERGQPMERLPEIANSISIYYNKDDKALLISDITKSNAERLGTSGTAHPYTVHNKVNQIDCTSVIHGFIEHNYFLSGTINADIKISIDDVPQDSIERHTFREATTELPNLWRMKKV